MTKIAYKHIRFQASSLAVIDTANAIIAEYAAQGFDLTVRQLYYQFVARDLIQNHEREYKKLGSIVSNGRMAGLISWTAIRDRTRQVHANASWESPAALIADDVDTFGIDLWADQSRHVEVWIEKDALAGVLQSVCPALDVRYFSCRGYTSQSAMWRAAQRLCAAEEEGKQPTIIHLGDHDPSGIDMSRDILDRLTLFGVQDLDFRRIALNMSQIHTYAPPPNPAKMTDSRFSDYYQSFGDQSWELDALDPTVLASLITTEVTACRDELLWEAAAAREALMRAQLREVSDRFDDVIEFLHRTSAEE